MSRLAWWWRRPIIWPRGTRRVEDCTACGAPQMVAVYDIGAPYCFNCRESV